MLGSPAARAQKRTAEPLDSGGYGVDSTARTLRQKTTNSDATDTRISGGAMHERPLRTAAHGGFTSNHCVDTVDAASPSEEIDRRPSKSRPQSRPVRLERPRTAPQASIDDGVRQRSRQRARDGHDEEHTSVPLHGRRQGSALHSTRASSASVVRRRARCGKAECGAPGSWQLGCGFVHVV